MILSKEQWLQWLRNPVTISLRDVIKERQEEGHQRILHSTDPQFDQIAKGIIMGLQETLDWEPEVYTEEEESK